MIATSLAESLLISLNYWSIHQVLSDEPSLKFIRAQDLADQQVIGSVIAGFIGLTGHRPHLFQDDFVRFEDARQRDRNSRASSGCRRTHR